MIEPDRLDGEAAPVASIKAWIGDLEVGARTGRGLHGDDGKGAVIKAWTDRPETFRARVFVPGRPAAPDDLDVRLRLSEVGNGGKGRGAAAARDLPMAYRGMEENNFLFEAEASFDFPGFFTLTAVASLPAEGGPAGDIAAFAEGQEALVIVHPGWVRGARIFEAYTRYFGARRDSAGNVATGRIRDLIDSAGRFRNLGFDALWAMGVFARGRREIKGIGSPYAIRDHRTVDEELGTEAELRDLAEALHAAGLRFGVDFVANQTSWDCGLLAEHPDWYKGFQVAGKEVKRSDKELLKRYPRHRLVHAKGHRWRIRQGHSRYDEWHDVAQLDWNMRETLLDLIRRFDVDFFRCDMAMLTTKRQRYEENGEERWEERWPGRGEEGQGPQGLPGMAAAVAPPWGRHPALHRKPRRAEES